MTGRRDVASWRRKKIQGNLCSQHVPSLSSHHSEHTTTSCLSEGIGGASEWDQSISRHSLIKSPPWDTLPTNNLPQDNPLTVGRPLKCGDSPSPGEDGGGCPVISCQLDVTDCLHATPNYPRFSHRGSPPYTHTTHTTSNIQSLETRTTSLCMPYKNSEFFHQALSHQGRLTSDKVWNSLPAGRQAHTHAFTHVHTHTHTHTQREREREREREASIPSTV